MTEIEMTPPDTAQAPKTGLSLGSILLIVAVVIFVAVIGVQLSRQNAPLLEAGSGAPDFTVTTFDGEELSLNEMRGKVVVINFWASWCGPCHDEAAVLQQTWETYNSDQFVLLGLTHADIERDSREFIARYGLTFPNAPDPSAKIYEQYNLLAVPETFIVGPDGELAYVLHGPLTEQNMPEFIATIESLLGGAA